MELEQREAKTQQKEYLDPVGNLEQPVSVLDE